jgi:serine/threonine protein kinase
MFEGTPGRHSDQYSLAIVYFEMLMGQFPFQAGKPAWIALQHLHGVPDLSNLPEKQRPVVARALAKDPAQRHESCLALITALKNSLAEVTAGSPAGPAPVSPIEPGSATEPQAVAVPSDAPQPIPGYRTTEILGQGEFGEVWKAVAPDGRRMAVKIVYEDESDPQWVDSALPVVTKLKELKHPGLLAVERVEKAEGNLVVVSDLAESNLRQRFERCRAENGTGIPPEELLGLMESAAQAIDAVNHLTFKPHLDIKPENILLSGDRARVGDFWLMPCLCERSAALIGGLSPLYSAPEMFEGSPGRNSDQYSLAIVYVEMLTGLAPFQQGKPAWIALQHLHGVPDLANLSESQRAVITRALSKDPAQRFESCQAMIAALKASAAEAPPVQKRRASHGSRLLAEHDLPTAIEPAVFIGLGGAAAEVLAGLSARLNDRVGDDSARSCVRLLLLDSDGKSLAEKLMEGGDSIRVVPIRLRTTEAYAPRSAEILKWMSRRWFYNLPRDHSTGGFRPLGRLALVSHAERVRDAVRTALAESAEAAAARGYPKAPRVFVVSALGGGTGSGALIDVAYLARSELKRRGLPDDGVHGVLLHGTPYGNAERDKALANSFAALHELVHFGRPGIHYPGEPALGVPPFSGDRAVFGRTHVLRLGEGLSQSEWHLAAASAAEFLFSSAFTPGAPLLENRPEANREREKTAGGVQPPRSYTVVAFGARMSPLVSKMANRVCLDVIERWRAGGRPVQDAGAVSRMAVAKRRFASGRAAAPAPLAGRVAQLLVDSRLTIEQLQQKALDILEVEVGCDAEEYIRRMLDEGTTANSAAQSPQADPSDAIMKRIDRILVRPANDKPDAAPRESLYGKVAAQLVVQTGERGESFVEAIRRFVDVPELRIDGAWQHATLAHDLLQEMRERLSAQSARWRGTETALDAAAGAGGGQAGNAGLFGWSAWPKTPEDRRRQFLIGYARNRLFALLAHAVANQIRSTESKLVTLVDQLNCLSQRLVLLAKPFVSAVDGAGDVAAAVTGPAGRFQEMVVEQLNLCQDEITGAVEQEIDERVLQGDQGLRRFLDPRSEVQPLLSRRLDEASRRAVLACLNRIVRQFIEDGAAGQGPSGQPSFVDLLQEALPSRGGAPENRATRRLLIIPANADPEKVQRQIAAALPNVGIVGGPTFDVTLCTIHGEMPLEQVAREMIRGIDGYEKLAERLHSRVDIKWSPLSGAGTAGGQSAKVSAGPSTIPPAKVTAARQP